MKKKQFKTCKCFWKNWDTEWQYHIWKVTVFQDKGHWFEISI